MDVSEFRQVFPAFSDSEKYPDVLIESTLELAQAFVTEKVWKSLRDRGVGLYAAHMIVINEKAEKDPQKALGVTQSKSVGPGSVSYNVQMATDAKAGHWNLSVYGLQFRRLARMMGAGPIQVSPETSRPGRVYW